jgi:hypothetical protein
LQVLLYFRDIFLEGLHLDRIGRWRRRLSCARRLESLGLDQRRGRFLSLSGLCARQAHRTQHQKEIHFEGHVGSPFLGMYNYGA